MRVDAKGSHRWPLSADIVAAAALQSRQARPSPPHAGASHKAGKTTNPSKKPLPLPESPPSSEVAELVKPSRRRWADATAERARTMAEDVYLLSPPRASGSEREEARARKSMAKGMPRTLDMEAGLSRRDPEEGARNDGLQLLDDARRRRKQLRHEQREIEKQRENAAAEDTSPGPPPPRSAKSVKSKPPTFPPGVYAADAARGGLELSSF